jgi:hypothetical protein
MKEKGFHTRGFVSLLAFGSFIVMVCNGLVLYFAPQGRIAYWVDWRFMGITREDWVNMHAISSLLFVVAGIIHLIYNWGPMVSYLSKKVTGGLKLKREVAIALVLSLFVTVGPISLVPPLNFIIDLTEFLKEQWIISKDYEPPFGHAEQVSLKTFTKRMDIDFEKALAELREKGIKVESGEESLDKIAKTTKTSPMQIYAMIKKFEQGKPAEKMVTYTPELVEEKFSGTGVGRKTLAEVCKEIGADINRARESLRKNNIEMKDDEMMKDGATRRQVNPVDLLKVILVENYKLP